MTSKKIQEAIQELRAANDGVLSPRVVVDAARPRSSPLHNEFEWNNRRAARASQEEQARRLLLALAWAELEAWRDQYRGLDEFAAVFAEMDAR